VISDAAAPLAAALVALAPLAARGDSLACPGGIVSAGDSRVDLLGKCGRPALQEWPTEESAQLGARHALARRVSARVERWTYDFGKSAFVQRVTLLNGKVAGIERGSWGFAEERAAPERPPRASCDPAALAAGRLKLEVLARCGAPAAMDAWEEELRSAERHGGLEIVHAVTVAIEVWTYDFGRNRFLRFVRFEDGKVTAVETGGYGYAE
jgi:hypothetical protein